MNDNDIQELKNASKKMNQSISKKLGKFLEMTRNSDCPFDASIKYIMIKSLDEFADNVLEHLKNNDNKINFQLGDLQIMQIKCLKNIITHLENTGDNHH